MHLVLHKGAHVSPQLKALIQERLGNELHNNGKKNLRAVSRHGQDPKGYAAVDGARDMLNEMMEDSQGKLDNEEQRCTTYDGETMLELEEIRQDVASFNAQAAKARACVLENQGIISFVNNKIPMVEE